MARLDLFPPIMPNEALYSALGYYHLWSANDAIAHSNEELFGRRSTRSTFDLPNFLAPLAERLPLERGLSAERMALEYTHIRYLTAFVPRGDAQRALEKLIAGDATLHTGLGINASVVRTPTDLHFCLDCLTEMRAAAGRLWWRLDHQLPGVMVCPDHGSVLHRCPTPRGDVSQHGFMAATDATCPEDAEPLLDIGSEEVARRLLEVARRSAAVLRMSPKFESYVEITDHYRSQLREADLMISARQLDVAKFTDAFNAYHGSTLEALAPAFEKMASPDAWVLEMARKHTQAKHPLQHVLFQMFLDACPRREPPFGQGPWPCPNPIADHGRDALTIASVAEHREGHGIVGVFRCGCGYTYTKSRGPDGRIRGPRYRCFGPLLDPALTQMVADGATLRGAATALGIHHRAVAAAADRLGLGKKWKVPEGAGTKLGRAVALPPKARRVADPQVSRRPAKPRVDWGRVDLETRTAVMEIVEQLRCTSPPVMISLREIERRFRTINWIYLRRGKLPLVMAYLAGELESVPQFQERRLRDAIDRELRAGAFVTPSKMVRMASLKSDQWLDRAREFIEDWKRKEGWLD